MRGRNKKRQPAENKISFKSAVKNRWLNGLSKRQKLFSLGLIALLSLGALGAGTNGFEKGNVFFRFAETVGLKKTEPAAIPLQNWQSGTLQLSKEYVYAGGRMLAVEDYQPTPPPSP